MPQLLREVLSLPFSTAECDVGPIAEHGPAQLSLRYDAQGPGGTVWAALTFTTVIALRFTSDEACSAWMIEAYSRVCQVEESSWIAALRESAAAQRMTVDAAARHLVIYFDHVGCWEVVAGNVELIQQPVRSDASLG